MQSNGYVRLRDAGYRTAQEQYGLLTEDQLAAMGVGPGAVKHRVRNGSLERVLPGVLAVSGSPESYRRDLMAATLWAGSGSAASFRSAAGVWRFAAESRAVEISRAGKRRRPQRQFPSGRPLVVHQADARLAKEIVMVGTLPVTSVPWTLLDLAGCNYGRLGRVLDRAIRDQFTDLGRMWLFYENEWLRGRRGVAILRTLLVDRTHGIGVADSDLEELFWHIVRDFSLPRPTAQFDVRFVDGPGRVDFAYPDLKIAIECDSVAWHLDREAFERDRLRDLELQAMGWVVLRFTWAKLRYDPGFVAAQVEHHLKTRSAVQG